MAVDRISQTLGDLRPIDKSVVVADLLERDPDEVAAAFNVSREQAVAGLAALRIEGAS